MSKKSITCTSSRTQKPLTEYDSKHEADMVAARYEGMVSYHCSCCDKWHLSPQYNQTRSRPCPWCTGRDGKSKQSYPTKQVAQRRAHIIQSKRYVTLTVYECQWGEGWHLTKT